MHAGMKHQLHPDDEDDLPTLEGHCQRTEDDPCPDQGHYLHHGVDPAK